MHAIYQHRTDNEVPRRLPVVKDNNNNDDDDDDDDDEDDDRSAGVTLDVAQTAIPTDFETYGEAYWSEGPTKHGNYHACLPASGSSTIHKNLGATARAKAQFASGQVPLKSKNNGIVSSV
uniref:Uncharacterized protein n=1 Tax=Vespula pensylvanica TaxID=30213 RepID=A0A834NWD8_VESPE|nr:hypothetical protein H0235_010129 [Vespula pensylvanica]